MSVRWHHPFAEQELNKFKVLPISQSDYVHGYGTRLMARTKERTMELGFTFLLTCGDNNAVPYSYKQGLRNEITVHSSWWNEYIKDYDNAILHIKYSRHHNSFVCCAPRRHPRPPTSLNSSISVPRAALSPSTTTVLLILLQKLHPPTATVIFVLRALQRSLLSHPSNLLRPKNYLFPFFFLFHPSLFSNFLFYIFLFNRFLFSLSWF